ncbi:MAG: RDD family protein [Planctomycetota bacterium]
MAENHPNADSTPDTSVPIIAEIELTARKTNEPPTIQVEAPAHFEWILRTGGTEYWKLTCVCGKRLLSPAPSIHPYGKCSKCGRYLLLPGYDDSLKVLRVPARSEPTKIEAAHEDRNITVTSLGGMANDLRISLNAASVAANRLRPQQLSTHTRAMRTVSGRISAWPLSGKIRRLLAAFLDLNFGICVAGVVMALAGPRALEPFFSPLEMLLATIWLALAFNDSVIHLILGSSLGKRLVVLVVRTEDGEPCGPIRTLIRAWLKWLLIPGWLIGAFDSAERTLHDLLAGTLVLRGRLRHKTQKTETEVQESDRKKREL